MLFKIYKKDFVKLAKCNNYAKLQSQKSYREFDAQ
jgi:hypothetical protein